MKKLLAEKKLDAKEDRMDELRPPYFLRLEKSGNLTALFGKRSAEYWSTEEDEEIVCP